MSKQRGVRIEPSGKRVRVYLGGEAVADTTRPTLVWEGPYAPVYYFPVDDVRLDVLTPDEETKRSASRGDATLYTVRVNGVVAPGAALRYEQSPIEELRDLVRFEWDAMEAWFEEDEEVFSHPRDPYHRVDVLASSRHIRVEVGGVTVAESSAPRLLFETGFPVRYYLPKTHVRMDLLERTNTSTHCPYKGVAEYWSVRAEDEVHEDVVWSYRHPLVESQQVAGYVSFYNEKVDIWVDGVKEERPTTIFA
ncbi:DUF427 domain-containing protein [Thermomonospora umbrina]|uniref:Uncharacterized protein (DUF427 family) n=1 Tax=Thermomonospora umbrina TaxID=111806 RepID=A0A3D9SV44_9ACTN|nr:DUF427 domain-containing protein [Thermomonospora umbrina]REE97913.1 uncharacterized protein (DUF427 family) [Thermomonospora umbrina]